MDENIEINFDDGCKRILNNLIIPDVTSYQADIDNVEIQLDNNRCIRFRLRDLLSVLGLKLTKEEPNE